MKSKYFTNVEGTDGSTGFGQNSGADAGNAGTDASQTGYIWQQYEKELDSDEFTGRAAASGSSGSTSYSWQQTADDGPHWEKATDSSQNGAGSQGGYGSQSGYGSQGSYDSSTSQSGYGSASGSGQGCGGNSGSQNGYYDQWGNGGQDSGLNGSQGWSTQGGNSDGQWSSQGSSGGQWNGQNGNGGGQNGQWSGQGYGGGGYNDSQWNGGQGRTGKEIASLVLGILSIIGLCCGYCVSVYSMLMSGWSGLILGLLLTVLICVAMAIVALVFAIKTRKTKKSGMATGGMVCAIIGLVMNIVIGGEFLFSYCYYYSAFEGDFERMMEYIMGSDYDDYIENYGGDNLYFDDNGNAYYYYSPDNGGVIDDGGSL